MTNDNPGNVSNPFRFQPKFENKVQSSCPHQESCPEFKNKKNDLSHYSFSSTPDYNSLPVQTSFHDASIQTPFVYDSSSGSLQLQIISFELGFIL